MKVMRNVQMDEKGNVIAGEEIDTEITAEEIDGRIQEIVMQRDAAQNQAVMLGGQVAKLKKKVGDTVTMTGEIAKLKARVIELELQLKMREEQLAK